MVSTERVGQIRKTKLYEARKGKGGLLEGGNQLFGIREEDVERHTTAMGGRGDFGNFVTIITCKKSLKPDDVNSSFKGPFGGGNAEFTEEKVGSYTLYVQKGFGGQAFCIPESKMLVVSSADTLRSIL